MRCRRARRRSRGCTNSGSGPSRSRRHAQRRRAPRTGRARRRAAPRAASESCRPPGARRRRGRRPRSRRACRPSATGSWPSPAAPSSTTRGSAADSPARTKRLTAVTRQRGDVEEPVRHVSRASARPCRGQQRRAADCRRGRPAGAASGPAGRRRTGRPGSTGSSSTAIAEAIAAGEVCFSGEKTTYAASATW